MDRYSFRCERLSLSVTHRFVPAHRRVKIFGRPLNAGHSWGSPTLSSAGSFQGRVGTDSSAPKQNGLCPGFTAGEPGQRKSLKTPHLIGQKRRLSILTVRGRRRRFNICSTTGCVDGIPKSRCWRSLREGEAPAEPPQSLCAQRPCGSAGASPYLAVSRVIQTPTTQGRGIGPCRRRSGRVRMSL